MEKRMNAGYEIIETCKITSTREIVLGKKTSSIAMFVTWFCKNGTNYYFGHYLNDEITARIDLYERAIYELRIEKEWNK